MCLLLTEMWREQNEGIGIVTCKGTRLWLTVYSIYETGEVLNSSSSCNKEQTYLKMVAMILEPKFKLISEHEFRFKIFKIEICLVLIYLCSS